MGILASITDRAAAAGNPSPGQEAATACDLGHGFSGGSGNGNGNGNRGSFNGNGNSGNFNGNGNVGSGNGNRAPGDCYGNGPLPWQKYLPDFSNLPGYPNE